MQKLTNRLHAGELRHRLTIQTPVVSDPGTYGEQAVTWTTYATVWGKVEPLSGIERFSMGQERADVTHAVTIRYCAGVKPDMRITFTRGSVTHTLKIVNVLNEEFRDAAMTLLCTETDVSAASVMPLYHVMTFNWANDTTAAADSATLDVSTAFTVEFWMRSATGTIPATRVMIAKWGTMSANQAFYVAINSSGKIVVPVKSSTTTYTWTSTSAVITDTAWHRYAVVYDGESIAVTIDGSSVAGSALATPASINTGAASLCVGNLNDSWGGYSFYGSLACIRIWNVARTAAQIAAAATDAELGATTGLVAEWTTAANDELTFADKSGNGNTLTLGTGTTKPVLTAAYALPVAGGTVP